MSVKSQARWQPTASIKAIKTRTRVLGQIRNFFSSRDVLEVDTPLLAHFGVTDVHVDNIEVTYQGETCFLQTSPEYHMKRLLCAGLPSIYQITKAFRDESCGSKHNIEFSMLEWYRIGFDYHELMDEVDTLLQVVLKTKAAQKLTYQQVFQQYLGVCPRAVSVDELKALVSKHDLAFTGELSGKNEWLDLLMGCFIEPQLGKDKPLMIYDYPASQSSLAVVCGDVAKRFEVYVDGIELANGFEELACSIEQKQRFMSDNQKRLAQDLDSRLIDPYFIAALEDGGLPPCAGVALGLDRLLMVLEKSIHIQEVMTFPFPIA